MKEKVILTRPNGEREEKKVIAHFKLIDDSRPNIKDVPILILNKNEMNNGNNVLEFMWQKNGVYQAINDENAWAEVKSVVVDIIKNNAKNINYIADSNLNCDIGLGRSLGLTVAQTDALAANFRTLVNNMVSVMPPPPVAQTPVAPAMDVLGGNQVVGTPAPNVVNIPQQAPSIPPVNNVEKPNEEVIMPFASDAPAIESVINPAYNQTPVAPPPVMGNSGPEIVENKETDFDKMQRELLEATNEYQEKIKLIIETYKKKINETINEANNLKEAANDHLKNAQAAEQIATMAYQNSVVNNQASNLIV